MLSLKQVENVCLSNDTTGKKCRYLSSNYNVVNQVFICLKLSDQKKKTIDEQVKNYLDYNGYKNKVNPPLGDNCSGYPVSLYVKQGYDVKE